MNSFKQVVVYSKFTSFGELALLTNKHRKAKMETLEDTHFAILTKDNYNKVQYRIQNQMLRDKINILKNYDLFSKLSTSNLSLISYSMKEQVYNRG